MQFTFTTLLLALLAAPALSMPVQFAPADSRNLAVLAAGVRVQSRAVDSVTEGPAAGADAGVAPEAPLQAPGSPVTPKQAAAAEAMRNNKALKLKLKSSGALDAARDRLEKARLAKAPEAKYAVHESYNTYGETTTPEALKTWIKASAVAETTKAEKAAADKEFQDMENALLAAKVTKNELTDAVVTEAIEHYHVTI